MKTRIKTVFLAVLLLALMIPSGVFAYANGNRTGNALSIFNNLQPVSGTPETLTSPGFSASLPETSRQGFERNFAKSHPESTTREPISLLGFELRFLGFCVRSGIIYTDPFGLYPYVLISDKAYQGLANSKVNLAGGSWFSETPRHYRIDDYSSMSKLFEAVFVEAAFLPIERLVFVGHFSTNAVPLGKMVSIYSPILCAAWDRFYGSGHAYFVVCYLGKPSSSFAQGFADKFMKNGGIVHVNDGYVFPEVFEPIQAKEGNVAYLPRGTAWYYSYWQGTPPGNWHEFRAAP